jgi:ABC-type Zn uptake system ZnuABC Zn-binding protein ZnuA
VEILQKSRSEDDVRENRVPVIFITHISNEKAVKKVVEKIGVSDCADVKAVIRVES